MGIFFCKICQKEYKDMCGLGIHIKTTHQMSTIDYYDRYYQGKIGGRYIWPEDKMIISMRYSDFATVLDNLEKSPHGSLRPNLAPQKIKRI
jgi:hypothetical protein